MTGAARLPPPRRDWAKLVWEATAALTREHDNRKGAVCVKSLTKAVR